MSSHATDLVQLRCLVPMRNLLLQLLPLPPDTTSLSVYIGLLYSLSLYVCMCMSGLYVLPFIVKKLAQRAQLILSGKGIGYRCSQGSTHPLPSHF